MENLISSLPFGNYIVGIVIIALGTSAAIYMVDAYRDKKKVSQDKTDDRLIILLQQTVSELEKKVNKQTKDISDLTDKVESLEKDNERLVKILQGRDSQTQEYYKQAFESMKIGRETNELMKKLIEILTTKK
jgi:predicted RNase H-like nuclease (RuvC/YqgF family)